MWNYQKWNAEEGRFETEKLNGKVQISTNEVIRDMAIPVTINTSKYN